MPIRAFVAIPIGEPWDDYLAALTRDLSRLVGGVSWVKPGNFHMTLRFLGDLGESGVARLGDAMARGAEGATAPVAELGGIGAFPSLERPRVLWVGLARGGDELLALGRRVNAAIDAAGFERADKPFRPHLTLGRVREGARGLEALRGYAPPPAPPAAPLDRIVVMKSDLHPSGSRYTALREVRLPPQR
ncbi:MAG TPA: RNA 2',3'-cyclic phosphodiesterase [Candidatus Eisenbacteria bacterium]|nr:RNA 2',3'-cyclic phosphodiesterase [Candidatus Eisenbacteria bacterium]